MPGILRPSVIPRPLYASQAPLQLFLCPCVLLGTAERARRRGCGARARLARRSLGASARRTKRPRPSRQPWRILADLLNLQEHSRGITAAGLRRTRHEPTPRTPLLTLVGATAGHQHAGLYQAGRPPCTSVVHRALPSCMPMGAASSSSWPPRGWEWAQRQRGQRRQQVLGCWCGRRPAAMAAGCRRRTLEAAAAYLSSGNSTSCTGTRV
jgi:hypothetical protein